MLAVHTMSHGAQAIFFLAAFILFVVGAILAWIPKAWTFVLLFAGLALIDFVWFYNALAAS